MLRVPMRRSPRILPPIGEEVATCSGYQTSQDKSSRDKPWSRFHSGCQYNQSIYLDWASEKADKKSPEKSPRRDKTRPFAGDKDQHEITNYLDNHKEFLEHYVSERMSQGTLEKWLQEKMSKRKVHPSSQLKNAARKEEAITRQQIFLDLLNLSKEDVTEHSLLWELVNYITSSVGVDAHRVYKLYPDHPSFVQYFVSNYMLPQSEEIRSLVRAETKEVELVLEVGKTGACRRLSRTDNKQNFPKTPVTLFKALKKNITNADHVMYQPILTKHGKTAYVIEMWRVKDKFQEVDEEISSNFVVLGSLALQYSNMYMDKKRERDMSGFLLDVVKAIFEEMVDLDQVIKKILEFAQRLVNADRASLFLVDYRNCELVSTVFDLKVESGLNRDNNMAKKEIRMPINRGIAGHVALSGEAMNIPDAYSDHRFNREVDEATGYKTRNILCMPIKVEGSVIGVVQMVNKRNYDCFDHEDEVAFEIFSTFFGIALHHARLYDRIMRKEQKYRVALEVLSYHNTCKETDVMAMLADETTLDVDLNNYYLDPFKFDEMDKCKSFIKMFSDLFDLSNFDLSTLTRFVLTVKKNYRTVPYHNFDHGWTVAQSMYVMLKNDYRKRFNYKMRLALFVACLCHDLDHRGYTNKYTSDIASPLAAMYTTSTLENHHFNITVTILQQDGHNIFSHITSEDYKEILGLIRHCILATDLAKFLPNLEKLKQLYADDTTSFNWSLASHRDLAMALSMTAADLSASAKPWDIQLETVKVIFEEFYDQGDKERAAGREPIPMMDRHKPDEQPACQVGFLSQICIPCYSILTQILPNTRPMYDMALKNLRIWKEKEEMIQQKRESGDNRPMNFEEGDKKNESELPTDVIDEVILEEEEMGRGYPIVAARSGIWMNIDRAIWIDQNGVVLPREASDSTDSVETSEETLETFVNGNV